eukprot:CAMPEP_0181106374 /NCGR_PEP_ID=MMETSP1071-20121207/16497_1 /TAXON_ID=35127 /ORGANISM="Thalassiosira sp., Strain NH16" /LENGTH=520 /DNA_ID=CAMNT_0023189775 /DNA_START=164 /DNA_END=1726 /DNA_ORIENTATION=+
MFLVLGFVALLVVSTLLVLRGSPPLRSSKSLDDIQAQQIIISARTQNLDGVDGLTPYATLLATMPDRHSLNYGQVPLTGVYVLGEGSMLRKPSAAASGNAGQVIGGSIQFPLVDLSTLITDEAAGPQHQGLLMRNQFGIPIRTKMQITEDSFLTSRSSFKSAIADYQHANPDQKVDHALLTRCGYKMGKVPNQDRSIIINFVLDAVENKYEDNEIKPQALLMGIFDGHGAIGHAVSHFIALEFPKVFCTNMRKDQGAIGSLIHPTHGDRDIQYIRKALIETFLELDGNEPVKGNGGSTASVLFYPGLGSKVYIANTGDSTTIIAAYSKTTGISKIIVQNRKHKPHLEDERQRIENAGGQIMIPPSLLQGNSDGLSKETSRVVIPDKSGNPFNSLALAMSRSIGDFDGKAVGLIAEPEVDVWDEHDFYKGQELADDLKRDTEFFAVSASDGVYDVLTPQEVVEYLGRSLFESRNNGDIPQPLEACERLIREASRLWLKESGIGMAYRDDITVGVSRINFPA